MALARNSSKASRALCSAIASYLGRQASARNAVEDESLAAALNQNIVARSEGKQ
jgi:hypothetical protein